MVIKNTDMKGLIGYVVMTKTSNSKLYVIDKITVAVVNTITTRYLCSDPSGDIITVRPTDIIKIVDAGIGHINYFLEPLPKP